MANPIPITTSPVAVPQASKYLSTTITIVGGNAALLNAANALAIQHQVSYDGGTTWVTTCTGGWVGGGKDDSGNPIAPYLGYTINSKSLPTHHRVMAVPIPAPGQPGASALLFTINPGTA